MKKTFWSLVLVVGLLVCCCAPALAEDGTWDALLQKTLTSIDDLTKTTGKIVVQGAASVAVTPDVFTISAGITVDRLPIPEAQEAVNQTMNTLVEALTNLGIPPEDMATSYYNIYPSYDYSSGSGQIVGYTVSSQMTIKVRDFDKINAVIDAAVASGANEIQNLQFDYADKESAYQQALRLAISAAQVKAAVMADAMGMQLGVMLEVNEGQQYGSIVSAYDLRAASVAGDSATKIMAGQSEISAQVTMTFEAR